MEKILFINACVRPSSRTLELANHVLTKLSGKVEQLDLYNERLLPLDLAQIEIRDKSAKNKDFSDSLFNHAKQFANADIIVVAAPYWDLMFPAVVKSYFENITVNGLTFCYGENGIPSGLCKAKKLIYVTTAGGPIIHNFGYEYIMALAKSFYGIKDVQLVKAECLDVCGADVLQTMQNAKNNCDLKI